ncbi:MAG TPA: SMC-Scp complex subunit ScpB [Thermoplasmata archaeon]|nr:SMC-Scp complex subunit ScpB [Thermoplasmata archaeon]
MPSKLDELVLQVEAVLFAAGRPLSVKEVTTALNLEDYRPVLKAIRTLEQTYANRQSALEVRRVGDRYALQLEERFVPTVHAVTPVEMAPRTLRALTLIAYHQPILQSVLVRMIGDVAYEEVQHLRGLGLVRTEPKGSTLELTTTRRFAEYFGIASTRPEEIRRFLEQKLGVAAPEASAPDASAAAAPPPDAAPLAPAPPSAPAAEAPLAAPEAKPSL